MAESERTNIHKRQEQGIAAAKARGVRFGRPEVSMPEEFPEIVKEWENKKITFREALEQCHMSKSTFYRRLQDYRKLEGEYR